MQGESLRVEKLEGDVGSAIELKDILMVGDGDKITIGAPVIANLPEAVECQTRFDNAAEQTCPYSSLHLQRVAAGDVDAAFAKVHVVARKRGEKGGPVSVGEDRAARGELVRDVTLTEPTASRQRRSTSRNIEAVGAN